MGVREGSLLGMAIVDAHLSVGWYLDDYMDAACSGSLKVEALFSFFYIILKCNEIRCPLLLCLQENA